MSSRRAADQVERVPPPSPPSAGSRGEDQEDFGLDYAETLKAWRARFDAAEAQGRLPAGFDRRFCDLWRFYLTYCEGGFRAGGITVSQVTLVKR
jgi:cyclopropane-fatty-acyl-phospholipid synthase